MTTRFLSVVWLASGCGGMGIKNRGGVECYPGDQAKVDGTDIWVGPDGSDRAPGDTEQQPFRTLAKALCSARAGQTVHVLLGTYKESVLLGEFGGKSDRLHIVGVPDGEALPVLDGKREYTMGIAVIESTNITVRGLEFRNYTDEGLFLVEGSGHVVQDCRFTRNGFDSITRYFDGEGFGLMADGVRDITIEGNEVWANGPANGGPKSGILGTGIDTWEIVGGRIVANHVWGNTGGGILVEDSRDVLVEGNQIEDNQVDAGDWWDAGIWVDGGRDITIRGNTVIDHNGPGIEISDEDEQNPRGYLVQSNVVTDNRWGIFLWNFGRCPRPRESQVRFESNTVENNKQDWWCRETW